MSNSLAFLGDSLKVSVHCFCFCFLNYYWFFFYLRKFLDSLSLFRIFRIVSLRLWSYLNLIYGIPGVLFSYLEEFREDSQRCFGAPLNFSISFGSFWVSKPKRKKGKVLWDFRPLSKILEVSWTSVKRRFLSSEIL